MHFHRDHTIRDTKFFVHNPDKTQAILRNLPIQEDMDRAYNHLKYCMPIPNDHNLENPRLHMYSANRFQNYHRCSKQHADIHKQDIQYRYGIFLAFPL